MSCRSSCYHHKVVDILLLFRNLDNAYVTGVVLTQDFNNLNNTENTCQIKMINIQFSVSCKLYKGASS